MPCLLRPLLRNSSNRFVRASRLGGAPRLGQIRCMSLPARDDKSVEPKEDLRTQGQKNYSVFRKERVPDRADVYDRKALYIQRPRTSTPIDRPTESLVETRNGIEYTITEQRILSYLRTTENHINKSRPVDNKVSVYFVGGWVRDKLLGKLPDNADFALKNIEPAEFVQHMMDINGWKNQNHQWVPPPSTSEKTESIAQKQHHKKIICGAYQFQYNRGAGADKLNVAGIVVFSMQFKMEFVKTRTAQWNNDKGTILEDAMSRELTINAMYVRTKTQEIFDPTKSGLKDLESKVLRTPKAPKLTLLDDPIRVLRVIRMASRFHDEGFTIDKYTLKALSDHDVRVCPHYNANPSLRLRKNSLPTGSTKNSVWFSILATILLVAFDLSTKQNTTTTSSHQNRPQRTHNLPYHKTPITLRRRGS
jgi:hypothetical protein